VKYTGFFFLLTVTHITIRTFVLTPDNNNKKIQDVKKPWKNVIYFECMCRRVREADEEAGEEFILGQYGNSIE